jgi:hypothetical protein
LSGAQFDKIITTVAKKVTWANSPSTVTAWVSGTGTAMVWGARDGGADNYGTVTTLLGDGVWQQISVTFTPESAGVGNVGVASDDATSIVYVGAIQAETNPYPTSFIPTTTAALTRNAEVLKYPIANNRTAAQESIFVKFAPLGGSFANDGIRRYLSSTDTKLRNHSKNTTGTVIRIFPNSTDVSAVVANGTSQPLVNTSYVSGAIVRVTPNPQALHYLSGSLDGTSSTNTWDGIIAWNDDFFIGSGNTGLETLNGIIQSIAFFNRALSATGVAAVSTLLANS